MTTQPIDREELFHAAAEISDPQQRKTFLQEKCQGDAKLIAELEELLRHDGVLGSFLSDPVMQIDAEATQQYESIVEKPGQTIGAFKLREQIGEGGFGLVFVAEQTEPVRRKVALKIIKPGMDTKEVLARFNAEQQALALMDHPHIARVFDAGVTESGRPYFVMELVKGVPIVEYCNQQKLSIEERLELFITVCQAVQHAHTKGIIHRDLKPSNIMIAPHDGVPVVKVIDFGVAKAIGQQLTNQTIYTSYAQMIGTPLYMSPEQAEINALDVDIRSDVYSLGVLLYELLTGTTPFDRERFSTIGYDEIRRIIKEEEPPRPSTRLTTLGELLTTVSTERHTVPGKLSALVKGDLDWIVMKALEKDRKRRYQTANELAEDVQRYLGHELVEARPPSVLYRLRKLIRRNKTAAIVATTILLALAMTTVGTSIGFVRARKTAEDLQEKQTDLLIQHTQFLISERQTGYKERVFEIIRELLQRKLSPEQREQLPELAVACLGDPAALGPFAVLKDFDSETYAVRLNPSGTWLAVSLESGESFLYEIATGDKTQLTPPEIKKNGERTRLTRFRFINDRLLVLTQLNTEVQFWAQDDRQHWSLTHKFDSEVRVGSVATTRDEKWLLLSEAHIDQPKPADIPWFEYLSREYPTGEKQIHLWNISDLENPRREKTFKMPAELAAKQKWGALLIEIDPQGRYAAGMYFMGEYHGAYAIVWNLKTGESRYLENGFRTRFSSDGRWLSIIRSGSVELFEVEHLDEFPQRSPVFYQRGDFLMNSSFTDGGRSLLLPGDQTSRVKVWSVAENQEIATFAHRFVKYAVASENGKVLVTRSVDSIHTWKLNELPERLRLFGHEGGTTGMAYSPDGRYLATTGKDHYVRIWDTVSGEFIEKLPLGENDVGMTVDFSDNGRWLAAGSGGPSSQVWIWDTTNWDELAKFDAEVGRKTWSVHFCDSDRRLAVAGRSGLRLLNVTSEPEFAIQPVGEETLLTAHNVLHLVSDKQTLYWLQREQDEEIPDGLYSYSFADTTMKGKLIETFNPALFGLALHPQDGLYYAPSSQDRSQIKRRSLDGRELESTIARGAKYMAVHSRQPWVALAVDEDLGGFEIRNRESGESILRFPARGTIVWYLACHPERNQLAVARSGGAVELWNLDEVEAELEKLGL